MDDRRPAAGPDAAWAAWGRSPLPADRFAERLEEVLQRRRDDEVLQQLALRLEALERDVELAALAAERLRARAEEAEAARTAAARLADARLAEVAAQVADAETRLRLVEGSRTWRYRTRLARLLGRP
ncbi:MAG TPA: hypothetical protein VNU66_02830 [Mycobacteriales bacterium]|nr:hypothetical protein [Mycobacteriales bacterium]